MSEQNQRPETILEDPSLALKAQRTGDMEGEPTLRPGYYENNPRFIVTTKVPADAARNHGKIEAKLSNRAFHSVMRALEAVANSNGPIVLFMDNKGHRFIDKKRDPNPSIMSCIKLEKNAEGVISICISAGNKRPLIEFPFLDDTYHQFRDANGPMPVAMASRLYCLAWVDTMRDYMGKTLERHYKKPEWMNRNRQGGNSWGGNGGGQQQGGNNWGGGNRQGGNGGGNSWGGNSGQQSSAPSGGSDFSFDSDVPL